MKSLKRLLILTAILSAVAILGLVSAPAAYGAEAPAPCGGIIVEGCAANPWPEWFFNACNDSQWCWGGKCGGGCTFGCAHTACSSQFYYGCDCAAEHECRCKPKLTSIQPGSNVAVDLGAGASIRFDNVNTPGEISLAVKPREYPPPANLKFVDDFYFDISSSANYSGYVTVTLPYTYPQALAGGLRILHWENGTWEDVTVSVVTEHRTITGRVTSLSPFALAEPAPPIPTGYNTVWLVLLALISVSAGALLITNGRKLQINSLMPPR